MIFIVGMERYPDQCVIQMIDIENGKYLLPKTIKNEMTEVYVESIYGSMLKLRPSQIIFDEYGGGDILKKYFMNYFNRESRWNDFEMNDYGQLKY